MYWGKPFVVTEREQVPSEAQGTRLHRTGCTGIELRLAASELQEDIFLFVWATQSIVFCYSSLSRIKQLVFFKSCAFCALKDIPGQGPWTSLSFQGAPGHTKSKNLFYRDHESSQECGLSCWFGKRGHWWGEQRCHLGQHVFVNRIRVTSELEYIFSKSRKLVSELLQ